MNDLDRALADITAIRSQMARGAEFRGYGPMTVAATGLLAMLAAGAQALWLPDPQSNPLAYVALWVATAAMSFAFSSPFNSLASEITAPQRPAR